MARTPVFADHVHRPRASVVDGHFHEHAWHKGGQTSEAAAAPVMRRTRALRLVPSLVSALALAVGVFAGTAYAYFATTGTGTGSVGVATLQAVHVEPATATVTGPLFPGGTGTLVLLLTNPNGFGVIVVGVAQDGPVTVTTTSGGGAGCASDTGTWPSITKGTSDVSVTPGMTTGLDLPLAAASVNTVTVAGGATMGTSSNTTCQGASFHIPVSVTVHS